MIDDGAVGQLGKIIQMVFPVALGVKQGLVAVFPKLLDDRPEGGPVMGFKLGRSDEGDATAMHPEADGHLAVWISRCQADMAKVRHESLAGLEDFFRLGGHVHGQADITAQFISDDVKG